MTEFVRAGPEWARCGSRPYVVAYASVLGGFTSFEQLGALPRLCLAQKVFGPAVVEAAAQRVADILGGCGYHVSAGENRRTGVVLLIRGLLERAHNVTNVMAERIDKLPLGTHTHPHH